MAPPYPKLLALELEAVELVRSMVGGDLLAEAAEHQQTWRSLGDEPLVCRPLICMHSLALAVSQPHPPPNSELSFSVFYPLSPLSSF